MTDNLTLERARPADDPALRPTTAKRGAIAGLTLLLGGAALFGPSLVTSDVDMTMSMGMTHYMELLAANQPRNMLLFMGVPVLLAETLDTAAM